MFIVKSIKVSKTTVRKHDERSSKLYLKHYDHHGGEMRSAPVAGGDG